MLSWEFRVEALSRVEDGEALASVARRMGFNKETLRDWVAEYGYRFRSGRHGGGARPRVEFADGWQTRPVVHTGHGRRLDIYHRTLIEVYRAQGKTHAQIAGLVGCSASTITREINKHRTAGGHYFARRAQVGADRLKRRPKMAKLEQNTHLRRVVVECLNKHFSPGQVVLHLRRHYLDREDMRVSHETIYQALYVQGRGSLREEIRREKALRTGRTTRIPRSRLTTGRTRSWVEGCHISTRPAEAADRAVPGHWEGDLVLGAKNQSAIITLVERASRFTLIRRLPADHLTGTVTAELVAMMSSLPQALRKSLTWDQGDELARHRDFTIATNMAVYFCDPHSPWQRGTNENTNGLIREFFPKGINFRTVFDADIHTAQDLLNIRPRATLDGMTPAEKLDQLITSALTT
ncbi:IS30 family transposase [Ruania alkalisoli]|uniref:IS30 family transposase n=1 Tax=Ruania alkalisoli TaxID=2779775 RepID=UPI003CCD5323